MNLAAASNGGTPTAATWSAGNEPSKAIDETVANVEDAIMAYSDGDPPAYSLELPVVVSV